MAQPEQKLTPAEPDDLADSLSFALRHEGRKSQHDSDKLNADIVAKRLVRHLGSGLIDQSQKATAAAIQIADK